MSQTTTGRVCDPPGEAGLQAEAAPTDAELLRQFALRRSEEAFGALLHRHGPLVFGICRRVLADLRDAEDAFQATFLVLARRAGGIARPALLGNWLYGVALRVAARVRRNAARRRARERDDFDLTSAADDCRPADPDLAPLVHEEVGRLPDKYRAPVVLCYLEGRTNEEAADRLRCPVGTVKTRLDRARELLRARLARRGVAPAAVLLAVAGVSAAVPPAMLSGTARAAGPFAAGASAQALALSTGVLRTMLLEKIRIAAAALALAVAVVTGVGVLGYHGLTAGDEKKGEKPREDKDAILGSWKVVKVEEDGKDVSDGEEAKVFRSKPLTVTADKIVLEGVFEMTYKLDPAAKPKAIDLDNRAGKTFDCVYSLDGDTLKICAPLTPGGGRPKEVAGKEGTRLLVLKREPKDKK